MVDFQKRDTTRGISDDEADEQPPETSEADGTEPAVDEGDSETESAETTDDSGDGKSEPTPGAAIKSEDAGDTGDSHEHAGHDHHAHDIESVSVAVVTVSSTRTREDDTAGDAIASILTEADHTVATRDVIRDDFDNVQSAVDALVGRSDVDIVITTGGTGVSPDDVTVEAVEPLCEKVLPGFGELFRRLSYEEIGTKVVGSRAMAGVADGVPVFCLPGSENATRLATEEIIVEQAPHLAGLAQRE